RARQQSLVSMKRLEGKRVLVTGGARGLGRAIVFASVKEGASVAFTYLKNEDAAQATLAEASRLGASEGLRTLSFRTSATDAKETETMVRAIEKDWGGIDVLVNNAGVTQNLPLALMEEEDFDHVMRVNVKGPFITSRAVVRGMIHRKKGVIVNIGSLAGA